MHRFCDYIKICRKKGNAKYDPFNDNPDDINTEIIYEGECKGETSMTNTMSEDMSYTIYINDNNIEADNRDIAYYKTNNEGEAIMLTIWDVKRYEHNTIIRAMHVKDGNNAEQ